MLERGASGGGAGGGGAGCAFQQTAADSEEALSVLSRSEHARNPVRLRWSHSPGRAERHAQNADPEGARGTYLVYCEDMKV